MIVMYVLVVSLLSILLVVPLTSADPTGTKCPPAQGRAETCVCQPRAEGGIIDMTPLSNTNGTARLSKL